MRWQRMVVAGADATACLYSAAWAGEVHVYTDRQIRPALLEFLHGAEQSLDVEMDILTDPEVLDAIDRAQDRGVQVRVILDPNQTSHQTPMESLKHHGVEVKWFPVHRPALMHRKLAIVDGTRIFAGSVNWTQQGLARNEELMVVVEDPTIANQLEEVFSADWSQSWLGRDQE